MAYRYDLVGNIVQILDRTPGSGVVNNPAAATAVILSCRDYWPPVTRSFGYSTTTRSTVCSPLPAANATRLRNRLLGLINHAAPI